MKKVTYRGAENGKEYPSVRVGETDYPLGEQITVSDEEADKAERAEGHKFTVSDAGGQPKSKSTSDAD